jgi:geranylgeranyl reductase family protein
MTAAVGSNGTAPSAADGPAAEDDEPTAHADAVVIGAGPAGSAIGYFLAQAGRDVVVCEKGHFPRDKVCGDGLTPRAVASLQRLGLTEEAEGIPAGWDRQEGLRMYGGGVTLDLPWPELEGWPAHSVTATRSLFDETLARNAEKAGARLWEGCEVTGPVYLTASQQRVAGVTYRRDNGATGTVRAPVVIAADGGSSRFGVALGLNRDQNRPMGVAIRAYYDSPRADSGMMEGFLELTRGGELLPGYGWIFPLDDGRVNVGWGLLNTSKEFRGINYRKTLDEWVADFPPEWGISAERMVGKPRSAPLPMAHNRKPAVHKGAVLIGDAAGMVNPFNGEGISYAIEAGAFAAEAADAALTARSDAPLHTYEREVAKEWGGYYQLGRAFVALMGHQEVMRLCTVHGMPRRTVMQFVFRLMAQLTNRSPRDAIDRVIAALTAAAPAA